MTTKFTGVFRDDAASKSRFISSCAPASNHFGRRALRTAERRPAGRVGDMR